MLGIRNPQGCKPLRLRMGRRSNALACTRKGLRRSDIRKIPTEIAPPAQPTLPQAVAGARPAPRSDPAGVAHAQHRNRKPFIIFARFCAPNSTLYAAQR